MNQQFAGCSRQQAIDLLKQRQISAGILAGNWLQWNSSLALLAENGIKLLHFDIMDNHFCPGLTVGPAAISQFPITFIRDVHLMVCQPWPLVQQCVKHGANIITLQAEGVHNLFHILQWLEGQSAAVSGGEMPILRGISLAPATPLQRVEPLLDHIDLIQLLALDPGYAGKMTVDKLLKRFEQLSQLMAARQHNILLAVDGGLSYELAQGLSCLGINIFVTGSALFVNNQLAFNLSRWQKMLN